MTAPGFDEFSVLRVFDDAVVRLLAMAVGDVNSAIRRDDNVGWTVELIGAAACDSRRTDSHQDLSARTEFDGGFAFAVPGLAIGHPDVSVLINAKTVRPIDQSGAKAHHDPAR